MARSIASGAFSPPPISSTASQSNGASTKLNVVSRLAIDGKAKQGAEGAHVYLYLKLNVPLDAVSPSQIVPIFAEEGLKLRDHRVHPLDPESAPYDFSSKDNPLLHRAARALNLPARSTKSYISLFDGRSHYSSSRTNGSVVSELEQRYSGYIIVSGYNICFVLPKEFPPLSRSGSDGSGADGRSVSRSGRRSSVLGRAALQFMVALDLWVPFISKPPKTPYLISIPIPRCLSNNIKFRLFPPSSLTTSFASLSSDEDTGGWDLATLPHVNRTSMRQSARANAYNTLADDESSESSLAGLYDNCLVQGTFTSTERISIRWATPLKGDIFPEQSDGRRRAQVGDLKSMTTCTILEQVPDGVKLRLDFRGVCSDIWFPGVATLLGLDVVLDTQGCQVDWPSIAEGQWVIDGDQAMQGFNIGPSRGPLSRQSSLELPTMTIPSGLSRQSTQDDIGSIPSQSGSTASLLRVPIPSQATTEYSFEDSPLTTPATADMASSIPSLTPSMSRSSLALGFASDSDKTRNPPSAPITLHINMNDLAPAPRNKLTFNISGTVVVSRNSTMSASQYSVSTSSDNASIQLPVFRVTSCEHHEESSFIRNQCEGANVELINSGTGGSTISQERRDSSNRKVVLPPGSNTKCGLEFSEVLVAPIQSTSSVKLEESMTPLTNRRGSPLSRQSSSQSNRSDRKGKSRVDSPPIIPWVNVKLSPVLSKDRQSFSYAGTITLPAPVSDTQQWLDVGFSLPPKSTATSVWAPDISIVCTSINGITVHHEVLGDPSQDAKDDKSITDDAASEKTRRFMWLRVNTAFPGTLEVVYLAKSVPPSHKLGSLDEKNVDDAPPLHLSLPQFYIVVARMSVDVDIQRGNEEYELRVENGKEHEPLHSGSFHHFAVEPLQTPQPVLARVRVHKETPRGGTCSKLLTWLLALILLSAPIGYLVDTHSSYLGQLRDIRSWQAEAERHYLDLPKSYVAPLEVTRTVTVSIARTTSLEPMEHASSSSEDLSSTHSPIQPPTVILSDPERERRAETQIAPISRDLQFGFDLSSLLEFIHESFIDKWRARIQVEDVKKYVNFGWKRLKRAAVVVLHWPMPVPEEPEDTP